MNFKIGDKVKILSHESDKCHVSDCTSFVEEMKKYIGKVFEIRGMDSNHYNLRDIGWDWSDCMVEAVCEFKPGDKIKNKITGKEDVVISVPGMPEYDRMRYGSAEEGMMTENDSWEYQKDWEKVEEPILTTTTPRMGTSLTLESMQREMEKILGKGGKMANTFNVGDKICLDISKHSTFTNTGCGTLTGYTERGAVEYIIIDGFDEDAKIRRWRAFDKEENALVNSCCWIDPRYYKKYSTSKKGGLMKKLTTFLKKTLDKDVKNYYQLGWVEVEDNDLIVTSEGESAYVHCMMLEGGNLAAYAEAEVKRIKKEEEEEKE